MRLSNELVSEFASLSKMEDPKRKETTLYGTAVTYQGAQYVRLDGTELLTPVAKTVEVKDTPNIEDGERVAVLIKDHTAVITGNFDSPSARLGTVSDLATSLTNEDGLIRASVESLSESTGAFFSVMKDAIEQEVSRATGEESKIRSTAESISLSVSNGSTSSTISLYRDGVKILSKSISFSGYVDFWDLENNSRTSINGDYIKSGTIDASIVTLYGADPNDSTKGGGMKAATGSDGKVTTYGAKLYGYDEKYYFLATDKGVSLVGPNASMYLSGGAVVSSTPIKVSSDARKKNSISYDMDKYVAFFSKLKPAFFKFNDGTSNRIHIGFIAQDVEKALTDVGLNNLDFAGIVIEHYTNDAGDQVDDYGLRYSEFISLNTYVIQQQQKKIKDLEIRITALENLYKEGTKL